MVVVVVVVVVVGELSKLIDKVKMPVCEWAFEQQKIAQALVRSMTRKNGEDCVIDNLKLIMS